jgi:hypothetical protein
MKLISESYSYQPDLPDNPAIHISLCYEWKYNDKYNIIFKKSFESCAYHITDIYTLKISLPLKKNKSHVNRPLSYRDAVIS